MNTDLKRKLPEDAPTDFIPKRLLPLVVTDGMPDRKAWECALLLKISATGRKSWRLLSELVTPDLGNPEETTGKPRHFSGSGP